MPMSIPTTDQYRGMVAESASLCDELHCQWFVLVSLAQTSIGKINISWGAGKLALKIFEGAPTVKIALYVFGATTAYIGWGCW